MKAITIQELKTIHALSGLPDEHLQWLAENSTHVEYEDGHIVVNTGEKVDFMMFILEGLLSFYMDKNGTKVHYYNFANDESTGGVTGLLPYSRLKTSPGIIVCEGKFRGLRLHKDRFAELEQLNSDFIQKLVGYMTERARSFATTQLHHEKVSALGKLAAGIAHELNNPSSAIDRISYELEKRLKSNLRLTENLLKNKINFQHIQQISELVEAKETDLNSRKKLSALQRMQKEEAIASWFESQGLLGNHMAGETFADAGYDENDLEWIRTEVGKDAFIQVAHWLENLLSSRRLMQDLHDASQRITKLVGAIKSHVHMDRTNELQPTDINHDIENTLTLLGHKIVEKNIKIVKNFCTDLSEVQVYISELNQVWTNLIDNAIFAMEKNGELKIETVCNSKNVKVSIIDNGSGIPKEIMSRIFDPFFTTKKVGEGTGIGLDLVSRIIKRHKGDIKVNSKPGRTEFIVCIPVN